MKEETKKMNDEESRRIDDEISTMKLNTELLSNIKQTIEENGEDMSYDEIMNNKETIQGIQREQQRSPVWYQGV